MIKNFLLVGFGGFLGSVMRYLTSLAVAKLFEPFPSATFLINIIGCALIGIIYGVSERNAVFTPDWRLFLATGLCGGFTTFSTFAYENLQLLQTQQYLVFTLYTVGSVSLGILAAGVGMMMVK